MTYEELGREIGKLCDEKNQAYGSSFSVTAEYLRLLFPTGIPPERYSDLGLLIRMFDKTMRVANGHLDDSYRDLAGYALLGERLAQDDAASGSLAFGIEVKMPDVADAEPDCHTPSHRRRTHPGEVLKKEFIDPGCLTLEELDKAFSSEGYTPFYVSRLLEGKSNVYPNAGAVLSRLTGTSKDFWNTLQDEYDRSAK